MRYFSHHGSIKCHWAVREDGMERGYGEDIDKNLSVWYNPSNEDVDSVLGYIEKFPRNWKEITEEEFFLAVV